MEVFFSIFVGGFDLIRINYLSKNEEDGTVKTRLLFPNTGAFGENSPLNAMG